MKIIKKGITRRPAFWALFILIAIGGIVFSFKYFSTAIPIVNINITMDRKEALKKATALAKKFNLGPKAYSQASTFSVNEKVKLFVDLEAGGKKAFIQMMKDNLYMPYTWQVRHFKEREKNELRILFTPEGTPYSFKETISENRPGPDISPKQARKIAEREATEHWEINFDTYKPIESSKVVKPSGRSDHTFVYERKDKTIGNGYYRLKIKISGDRITQVKHFIKIPEEFFKKYAQMRSINEGIARAASFAFTLLYILGGCIIGLFFLLKQRFIIWKAPIIAGTLIALLSLLEKWNRLPLVWMGYNTAESINNFLVGYFIRSFVGFLSLLFLYIIAFMAAESLTRKAFGEQIQFWKLFSKENRNTKSVLGQTIGGYLMVPIFIGIVIATYIIATRFLGWWVPYDELVNPDIIATYFPWINAIAKSLGAGFMEESLFRAVPLASAAIIGKRYGKKNLFIVGTLLLQAIIFGAAHANYPAQPAYARLLELIIPSILYGLIYLRFGLLPVILSHFVYDAVLFGLPLFLSSGTSAVINQIILLFLVTTPLLIILLARLRKGKWAEISDKSLNKSWKPPEKIKKNKKQKIVIQKIIHLTRRTKVLIVLSGLLGIASWAYFTPFTHETIPLQVGQAQSIAIAQNHLEDSNTILPSTWSALPFLISQFDDSQFRKFQHRFIWQQDKTLYKKLLGTYLNTPQWLVRFIRFTGTIAQRSEEYRVYIDDNARIVRKAHLIPESVKGAELKEQEARKRAHTFINNRLKIDPAILQEISAKSFQFPHRKKWIFTFLDTAIYPLKEGQARIKIEIDGTKVTDFIRYIHIPETYKRDAINTEGLRNILKIVCYLILFVVLLFSFLIASQRLSLFSKKAAIVSFFGSFCLLIIINVNQYIGIIATFNTSESFYTQLFSKLSSLFLSALFLSSLIGLLIGSTTTIKTKTVFEKNKFTALIGVCLGMFLMGTKAFIDFFQPSLEPLWPEYKLLASYFPAVAIIGNYFLMYLLLTAIALVLATAANVIWDKKTSRAHIILLLLFILITTAIIGLSSVDTSSFWLLSASIMGLVSYISYICIVRLDISIMPRITACYIATKAIQQGILLKGYIVSGFALTVIAIVIASCIWFRKLNRLKK